MQKWLILTGLIFVAVGLLWPILGKLPFGRLPGDLVISRPGFKVFFPVTTMILLSLVISLILWIIRK
jgi:hypothetical protein